MAGFIRDLYFNNIEVPPLPLQYDEALKKLALEIDGTEHSLLETLGEAEKALFVNYSRLVHEFMDISDLNSFEAGFRLGGQCIYDVFEGSKHVEK